MRYLLDTNICIYLIKNRPSKVLEQFRQHSPQDVAISTITLFELQYGIEKSQYRERSEGALAKFLLPLNLIALDRSAALEAAAIRAQLEQEGMPIGPCDLLIAGLAKSRDWKLVTNNTGEFERIAGLHVENWADSNGKLVNSEQGTGNAEQRPEAGSRKARGREKKNRIQESGVRSQKQGS